MNRINPIYILLLCLTLTILSFTTLTNVKNEVTLKSVDAENLEKSALKYSSLKKDWFTKEEIEKQIKYLIKDNSFKNADITTNFDRKTAMIKLKTKDEKIIHKFVNKLLNKKFIIKKLEITSRSVLVEVDL